MNNIIIHTLNAEEFAYTPRCPSRQFGRLGSLLAADFSTAKNGKAVQGILFNESRCGLVVKYGEFPSLKSNSDCKALKKSLVDWSRK